MVSVRVSSEKHKIWLTRIDDTKLRGMLEDCHSFCCSFYDQKLLDEYKVLVESQQDQEMSAFEEVELTEE